LAGLLFVGACGSAIPERPTLVLDGTTSTVFSPLLDGKTTSIDLDGQTLTVAVADTADERVQGLMEVTDLANLDGMLFVFDEARILSFTMKNTLIPLDLWFIDGSGAIVETVEMTPCLDQPCPGYPSTTEVPFALETPVGVFDFAVGDRFSNGYFP
jgi:uncharacterized membrane protein (UPF0127 family)